LVPAQHCVALLSDLTNDLWQEHRDEMLEQRRKQGAPAKSKKAQQNAQQEGAAIKCRSTADIKHKNRQNQAEETGKKQAQQVQRAGKNRHEKLVKSKDEQLVQAACKKLVQAAWTSRGRR